MLSWPQNPGERIRGAPPSEILLWHSAFCTCHQGSWIPVMGVGRRGTGEHERAAGRCQVALSCTQQRRRLPQLASATPNSQQLQSFTLWHNAFKPLRPHAVIALRMNCCHGRRAHSVHKPLRSCNHTWPSATMAFDFKHLVWWAGRRNMSKHEPSTAGLRVA